MTEPTVSRRDALKLVAVTAAGGVLMSRAAFAQEAAATTAAESLLMPGADVCVLTPETTEGPYYFDPALVRTDITEGTQAGVATMVRLQVVDAACRPIEGARVDIWHCNAYGQYSGYGNQPGGLDARGETFLRGTQFADARGMVGFETIYPGWYPGRTTHIHFMVYLNERSALTGQIFFPGDVSDVIYRNAAPYSGRGAERAVVNGNDGIARRAGPASVAAVTELEQRYLVAMIIGVDPGA